MTKKVDDLRREPDDEPVDDAARFRIDRVFVPPVKREASGPTPMRPVRGRPLTRPPLGGGGSGGTLHPGHAQTHDSELVEVRRKLSSLQRQLADLSEEMADKEDQLAAEVDARLAIAHEHDTLLSEHRARAAQLDEFVTETEARANQLAEKLGAEQMITAQLVKERDELVRAREDAAADRIAHDAAIGAHVGVTEERDALKRANDEAVQRIAALEWTLGEVHAKWNEERKEIEDTHGEEIAELEETLRVSSDAAASELQRLREVVRSDGTNAGLAVAAAKAENERELATLRKELDGAATALRAEHTAALDKLRAEHTAAFDKLRAEHGATLDKLRADHAAALDAERSITTSQRVAAESAKGGLEGELAKLRMANGKTKAEHESALASLKAEHATMLTAAAASRDGMRADHDKALAAARTEHVTAQAEAMTQLDKLRAEHDRALAAARTEHVTAQAEAMTQVDKLRAQHEVALRLVRTEETAAAKLREDKLTKAHSDLVIQHAADQVASARKQRAEIDRVEGERAALERAVEQARTDAAAREASWEKSMHGHHQLHDATRAELTDAHKLAVRHAEESTARGERIDAVLRELEELRAEAAEVRDRMSAQEATARRDREQLAAHLQAGLEMIAGGAGKTVPMAAVTPHISATGDLQVRFGKPRASDDD